MKRWSQFACLLAATAGVLIATPALAVRYVYAIVRCHHAPAARMGITGPDGGGESCDFISNVVQGFHYRDLISARQGPRPKEELAEEGEITRRVYQAVDKSHCPMRDVRLISRHENRADAEAERQRYIDLAQQANSCLKTFDVYH